jgi:ABC-type Mn2+/Zn2+ transport system permease subunit
MPAILLGVAIGFALKNDIQNSSLILAATCLIGMFVVIMGSFRYNKILKQLDKLSSNK